MDSKQNNIYPFFRYWCFDFIMFCFN